MHLNRLWDIVLDDHEDGSVTARVWVDGKLLRPECAAGSASAALAYVDEALSDVRPHDQVAVRTRGRAGDRAFQAVGDGSAQRWLSEQLASKRAAAPSETAKSGTHPVVRIQKPNC